jgi:eukaryotic-like serine/threonine-protein kinase
VPTPIECPHCQSSILIKNARPGRFRHTCRKCGVAFALTIPDDSRASPLVAVLEPAAPPPIDPAFESDETVWQDPDETIAHDPNETVSQEMPRFPIPVMPLPPVEDEETIENQGSVPKDLDPPIQPPRSLGGYRLGRRIGQIQAGTAFEASRKATGRRVVLTVIRPRWAALGGFVSRFAREAFAARQIEHPNLIRTLDFDIARGYALVASEATHGSTLADPSGRDGLDRMGRAAAILHAARGLKHAHEQGIYHRDVSLGKIRIDGSGLVRVADLGIGLTPETPEVPTIAPIPLAGPAGSPPAPSAEPPTTVFVREDVCGLGRALESLIGGSLRDRAMTPGLALCLRRMTGSGLEPAFADMGAVVRALEAELGVVGVFTPRDTEAAEFEDCLQSFTVPPLAKLRPKIALGVVAALGLFALVSLLLTRNVLWALGTIGFAAILASALLAMKGTFGRDPLFDRARDLILGGGRGNVLTAMVSVGLLVVVLYSTGLLGRWIFLGAVAVGLASAYYFAIDRPIEAARSESIGRATKLFRGFRRLGVSEDSVRRFACRHAGIRWEEFFEALFGYDALRSARKQWGADAGGKPRPRFARWRDPIADAIDRRIETRDRLRDRELFQAIEEHGLEARGINQMTARRKGHRIAEALVQYARQFRDGDENARLMPLMDGLNRVARRPEDYLTTTEPDDREGPPVWREALGSLVHLLFGPRTRFLIGGVLLAGFLIWLHQNDLGLSAEDAKQAGANAAGGTEKALEAAETLAKKANDSIQKVANAHPTKPLEVPWLSPAVARRLDGFGLGVAGLILILSSFFQGGRFAVFVVPGAIVAVIGPQLIESGARTLGPTSLMALAIGGGLFALGVVFGRSRD